MALPGENSGDIPLRLTKAGMDAVEAEASAQGIEKVEVVRRALTEYFKARGQSIKFTPKHGGSRKREAERDTVEQVLRLVKTYGALPQPEIEYRVGHKVYDLAWPEQKVAIEVAKKKRPADSNGWTVGHVSPDMGIAKIDEVLNSLPLSLFH